MALSALALFFLLLALVAAAIWLISGRPSLEPVAAFFGSLAAFLGAVALNATQVDRVWAITIVVVGLGLFTWSVVRAFRLQRPLGGTSEHKPTSQQRLRNRCAMLEGETGEKNHRQQYQHSG